MAIGTIGKYERLDVLGHGTSGVVYLAWDTLLRRQVALKEIRAAGPEMERVLNEARMLDRLRHPNIIEVHSVDTENGAILIDMELVRGRNLADFLKERNGTPLPVGEAGRIALAVLDALVYAHERRIIHRDVKPANILIGQDGTVKLTDFGLAEALGSGSVAGGGGTYPYMAPEDFAEEESSDYRADLWAVGVMLYEMFTGRRPFQVTRPKDPFAWKRAIETERPPRPSSLRPELAAALDGVIERALAKDKALRFPSARAFADALRAALGGDLAAAPEREAAFSAAASPAIAGTPAPFRFAGGAVAAENLDDLLSAAVDHWDEARRALLDGRIERWLRGAGEVYIADLAGELAAREGDDADDRLREFLDRSGLDMGAAVRRRETLAAERRRRGDYDGAAKVEAEIERLSPGRTTRAPLRLPHFPGTGGVGEPGTVLAPPRPVPSPVPANAAERPASRWWFWPLLALCLGPSIGALWQQMMSNREAAPGMLLASWVASGFLSAMLLLIALGINLPLAARVVCFVPTAAGLIAAGALTSALMNAAAALDTVIVTAGIAAVLLTVLLVQSASVNRLWRLWLGLVVAGALGLTALFSGLRF